MKKANKILSTVCALSMVASSAQGMTAFAADVDYSIRPISMNGISLGEGQEKSVDELKAAIAALGEVTFDNYASKRDDVIAIVESINRLSDEDKALLDVEMDPDAVSNTYWKTIVDATYVIEAGGAYDVIKNNIPSLGEEFADISGDPADGNYYKKYYDEMIDAAALFDALTDGAQKMLGNTPYLYKWERAYAAFNLYSNQEKNAAADALKNVVTSADALTAANYNDAKTSYEKAEKAFQELLDWQKDDVNNMLAPDYEKGEDILAKGAEALTGFKDGMLAEIQAGIAEALTFENAVAAKASAENAKNLYTTLISLDQSYADDALATNIDNYIAAAGYFVDADAIQKEDFTKENYMDKKTAIDNLSARYDTFNDEQKTLSQAAKTHVDEMSAAWDEFKTSLVEDAKSKIDAIGEFDYTTWSDRAKWADIGAKITAARTAADAVSTFALEVTNLADLEEKEKLYQEINADYSAANAYIQLVNLIGTVGDLATDEVMLDSNEKITAAETAYDGLTDEQKALVSGEYDKMVAARAEFKTLMDQKALIDAAVAELKTVIENSEILTKGYKTGVDLDAAVSEIETKYTALNALVEADGFGSKLASVVSAADKASFEKAISQGKDIIDLKAAGEAVKTSADALLAQLGIDINADDGEIKDAIEEFTTNHSENLDALTTALGETGAKVAAYKLIKSKCELSELGTMPTDTAPYQEYEEYVSKYSKIADAYEAINPTEAVAAVDDWASQVKLLFDEIEEACADRRAEDTFKTLREKKENFSDLELGYAERKHATALSNFIYIEYRIGQYQAAWNYSDTVAAISADYDTLDDLRGAQGDAAYNNLLCDLITRTESAKDSYDDMLKAIKDIDCVQEGYGKVSELEKLLAQRKVAYEFDAKVKAVVDAYVEPVSGFETEQQKYLDLWNDYAALSEDEKAFVTTTDVLAATEAKIVVAAIQAIDAVSGDYRNLEAAVKEADTCYGNIADQYKDLITNAAKLEEYDVASKFVSKVYDIYDHIDENNMDSYLKEITDLYDTYDGFEFEEEGAKKACDYAYGILKKTSARVVTMKCNTLPDPDDIRSLTDKNELDAIGARLDEIDSLYQKLPIEYKLLVEGYARYELDQQAYQEAVAAFDQRMADRVDAFIQDIGYYADGNVTMTKDNFNQYGDMIAAARAEYDALTDEQKALVKFVSTLTDAEKDYTEWKAAEKEAGEVKTKIDALEENVDESNYKQIRSDLDVIDAAEETLSERAKMLMTDADADKVNKVRTALEFIEAYMDIVDAIQKEILDSQVYNNIVNNNAIDISYALIISDIENQYNKLSIEQKLKVKNYVALKEARDTYNRNVDAAIELIRKSIDELDVDAIVKDAETKKKLDEIAEIIDSLSDENKEKIGSNTEDTEYATRLIKFAAAQKRYDALKTAAEVMEMIDALGDPQGLTEASFDDSKKAVAEAEAAYESLAASERLKIENYAKLEAWKDAIANFYVDHSGDVNQDGKVDIDDIYEMVQYVLGRTTPTAEQFERANIVKSTDGAVEEIDIYDVLAAIDLIEF